MIKLLLLVMMFVFGTSTVNAEKDTADIEDIISELAETKLDRQSTIKAKVDELSEDELKTVIANVNELTEPTEDNLAIKEAAVSKLEEIENVETSDLVALGIGVLGVILLFSAFIMMLMGLMLTGYNDESTVPLVVGVLLIIVMVLLIR